MSDVVIFPVGKEASADAYLTWCNANNPDVTADQWYGDDVVDKYGQRVVGYLGPTGFIWNNAPYPEPAGGPAMRADGTLNSKVEWPPEEDGD
jgi:hypothetical protein